MRTIVLFLYSAFIYHNIILGQITFRHTSGGTNHDQGRCVKQTLDGGYILTGSTGSFGFGNSDVYLIKLDSLGIKQWSNVNGGFNVDWGYSVVQTPDSGFIVCGYTNSFGAGGYDIYLLKVDIAGNVLWQKTYGGADWDFGYSIQNTVDAGYIITGETYSYGNGNSDVYLIKINSDGDVLWTKTYGGSNKDYSKMVKQTFDGGYILAGGTSSFGAGKEDVYVIKTNENGDTLWTKTFGGDSSDFANSIIQTEDGGYAIAGSTKSFNDGDFDYYIIKTDSIGIENWTQTYSSLSQDDEAKEILQISNGYVFCGFTKSAGFVGNKDVQLVFTDNSGWAVSGPTFGTAKDEEAFSIINTSDNGFAFVGYTSGEGVGFSDVLIIKTGPNGQPNTMPTISYLDSVTTNISLYENNKKTIIFPNPFTEKATIIVGNDLLSDLIIFNVLGEEVKRYNDFSNKLEIDRKNLSKGVYFFKLINGNLNIVSGKIIIY